MLKELKRAALAASRATGITSLVGRSAWRRQRLLILCYHGFAIEDEHEWNPSLFLSAAQFEERLRSLTSGGYALLPLAQGIERLFSGTLPPRAVALTFDDGSHDFYSVALPLLRRYRVPATLYLTTYYCTDQRAVFDTVCSYVLWKGRESTLNGGRFGLAPNSSLRTPADRATAYAAVREFTRHENLDAAGKDDLVRALAAGLGVDYGRIESKRILYQMTPDEVAAVAREGVDVQLHTHRHRTPRDRELFAREIRDNRQAIAAMTTPSHTIEHFCYPSGDYDLAFLPWLRAEAVKSATTLDAGFATPASDPLLLPRIIDHSMLSQLEIEGWLEGVAAFLPHRAL